MKAFFQRFVPYQMYFVVFLLTFFSTISTYYYLSTGANTLYGDAVSRLNISRKIIDNLTPGLAQLGNVWLPLPQVLMLPLIWNNYLWHTGLAGAVMSMVAFIIGGIFIYKSSQIITQSFMSSFFGVCVYAININALYFQTTAMSETLFICALSGAIYYFLIWIKTDNRMYLIPAAISVTSMTVIRYEALAILLASIIFVLFYTLYSSKKLKMAESNTILYSTLACLGFILWTVYLTTIFGDPLYWKNYYAGTSSVTIGNTTIRAYAQGLSFFEAIQKYFTSVVWMNGLIPTFIALLAIPVLLIKSFRGRNYYFLAVLLPLSIFMFMVLTLQRNTPIIQPALNYANIVSSHTSKSNEFNIRYGLLMLPMIALLCAFLYSQKYKVTKVVIALLFLVQLYSYVNPAYSVIYQIPVSIEGSVGAGGLRSKRYVDWLKRNYDGGYILISALKHDPQMFSLGYDYRTYIHEGTNRYWKESLKLPQRYAKWIVMDYTNKEDPVAKQLKDSNALRDNYKLVYSRDDIHIYKIKSAPERRIE